MSNPTHTNRKNENDELRFREKYRITSHRLKDYDYSSEGAYFVTICCKNRECLFGKIMNRKMVLNDFGNFAHNEWRNTEEIRKNVTVDEFVIMPNHIHGILFIDYRIAPSPKIMGAGAATVAVVETNCTIETNCNLSLRRRQSSRSSSSQKKPKQHGTSQTVGSIIRGFKIGVTNWGKENVDVHNIWQPNYYDRIIRDEDELNRIRKYIIQNPKKWESDRNNSEDIFM